MPSLAQLLTCNINCIDAQEDLVNEDGDGEGDEEAGGAGEITPADLLDLLNAEEIGSGRAGAGDGEEATFELQIQRANDDAPGASGTAEPTTQTMRSKA